MPKIQMFSRTSEVSVALNKILCTVSVGVSVSLVISGAGAGY